MRHGMAGTVRMLAIIDLMRMLVVMARALTSIIVGFYVPPWPSLCWGAFVYALLALGASQCRVPWLATGSWAPGGVPSLPASCRLPAMPRHCVSLLLWVALSSGSLRVCCGNAKT